MSRYAIAVHGGAGTILRSNMTPEAELEYRTALEQAIELGETILRNGGTALDAVEAAVIFLEDCPLFNAGRGSVFTHEGRHEMDASIMDGATLAAGAVAGVHHIKNPVMLARAVMHRSEHVFLSGEGAMAFAHNIDMALMPDEYFHVQLRYDQLIQAKKNKEIILDHTAEDQPGREKKFGTVGAVACDKNGNLAAATSTGGMTNKKFGRIGDSPITGAGNYANNQTCAVSCTGHGEYFIRAVAAHDVSCLMEYKELDLKQACEKVVHDKLFHLGGEGGLIAVDKEGNIELCFNSDGMYRAMKKENEALYVGIYSDSGLGNNLNR